MILAVGIPSVYLVDPQTLLLGLQREPIDQQVNILIHRWERENPLKQLELAVPLALGTQTYQRFIVEMIAATMIWKYDY